MENKENQAIYQKIRQIYKGTIFKNKNDEKAFLGLARIYLGRDSYTAKPDEKLRPIIERWMIGDQYFENTYHEREISPEGRIVIAQLARTLTQHVNEYNKKRQEIKQKRVTKTIQGKINEWQKTHPPSITKKLSPLASAYLGVDSEGRKLNKEDRIVEKRYEKADGILISMGKLSEEEKRAVGELYNILTAYDQRDYERRSSTGFIGIGRDTRTKKLDMRRDALRMQHANTINYSLEGIANREKVETALERTVPEPKKKTNFLTNIGSEIRKPVGRIVTTGLVTGIGGLMLYGTTMLSSCKNQKVTEPTKVEQRLAEVPKPDLSKLEAKLGESPKLDTEKAVPPEGEQAEKRFSPDPFKPVPEIEKALAEAKKVKTPEAKKTAEAAERTRCINWTKSKLEQGISSYKLEKETFRAKLNKHLAEYMRNNPNVVFRFIGDNKLYETNKVGPNGEIIIESVSYKTGASFGVIQKVTPESVCGDYKASLRKEKPKAIAIAEVKKPKTTIEEKIKETPKRPVEKKKEIKKEYKAIREEKKAEKTFEIKKQPRIEVRKEIEQPSEILTSLKKTTIEYRKAWSPFVGNYDYVRDYKTEEAESLYQELLTAFKQRSPEYMFLDRTPKSTRGAVPKLIAEFSSYERERRLERMLEEEDMNTLKNVTIVNFEPTRGNNMGYDYLIILQGTPEEKAAQAIKRIMEELKHMREKGHFDTYFWERDVKRNNPSAEAPVQGDIFIKGNGINKVIGAIFTPGGTEVKLVKEHTGSIEEKNIEDRMANDDIRIGKPTPKSLGGGNGGGVSGGAGSCGGVSGGAM